MTAVVAILYEHVYAVCNIQKCGWLVVARVYMQRTFGSSLKPESRGAVLNLFEFDGSGPRLT